LASLNHFTVPVSAICLYLFLFLDCAEKIRC
jgi:hypothetical protein